VGHAAPAGTELPYAGVSDVGHVTWCLTHSGCETKPVGTTPTPRSARGLCDPSGNVFAWTGNG
jgi:hypothetical protein